MLLSSSVLAMKILLLSSVVIPLIVAINYYSVIQFPIMWSVMLLFFKPPYVYVLINGIIISIAATSRYTSSIIPPPFEPSHVSDVAVFNGEEEVLDVKPVVVNGVKVGENFEEMEVIETMSCGQLEHDAPKDIEMIVPVIVQNRSETPRISHRKPPRAGCHREGGKKQILANMEMEETVKNTWEMIREGIHKDRHEEKSPTEDDDLNRRVEEFIRKVNHEIRLERQKSLEHYMEMMICGAN